MFQCLFESPSVEEFTFAMWIALKYLVTLNCSSCAVALWKYTSLIRCVKQAVVVIHCQYSANPHTKASNVLWLSFGVFFLTEKLMRCCHILVQSAVF